MRRGFTYLLRYFVTFTSYYRGKRSLITEPGRYERKGVLQADEKSHEEGTHGGENRLKSRGGGGRSFEAWGSFLNIHIIAMLTAVAFDNLTLNIYL